MRTTWWLILAGLLGAMPVQAQTERLPWEGTLYTLASWSYPATLANLSGFELQIGGRPLNPLSLGMPAPQPDNAYRAPLHLRVPTGEGLDVAICAVGVDASRACGDVIRLGEVSQGPTAKTITGAEPFSWDMTAHPDLVSWQTCVDAICATVSGGGAVRSSAGATGGVPPDGAVHTLRACAVFANPVESRCGPGIAVMRPAPRPTPGNERIGS